MFKLTVVVVRSSPLQAMVLDASLRLLTRRRLLDGMVKQLAVQMGGWPAMLAPAFTIQFASYNHIMSENFPSPPNHRWRHVLGGVSALAGRRHCLPRMFAPKG